MRLRIGIGRIALSIYRDRKQADPAAHSPNLLPRRRKLEVVLFVPNQLARFPASFLELSNLAQGSLFLTVSQLVPQWFNPLGERRLLFTVQSMSPIPHLFATVMKLPELHRPVPAILLEVPQPSGSIAQVQRLSGTPQSFPQRFPVEPPPPVPSAGPAN